MTEMPNGSASVAKPSLFVSLLPVGVLIVLLTLSVIFFGENSSFGPNQIALMLAAVVAAGLGLRLGFSWRTMQESMVHGVSLSIGAVFILLAVGALIGTWMMAGIVPTMIYYGLQVLSPAIFYAACTVICALVSVAIGSSWTTASTVGIALVGIAAAFDLNLGIAAGAIVSGAFFGDKLSPLSDTTNLAPAVVGVDLFIHIRHMLWTTIPALFIALVLFAVIGFFQDPGDAAGAGLDDMRTALDEAFSLGLHLLIPVAVVLIAIYRKMPAFPALVLGALLGGVFAIIFQQAVVLEYVGETDLPRTAALLKGFWMAMYGPFVASTGNAALDALLTRGGMSSMLVTIWLILAAMMFGAVMEKAGMLTVIANRILAAARTTGSLIVATLATSVGMNIVASDQYISIVVPGRMYRAEFEKRRLHPKNLSRALEDGGTMTSALVPWNTGAAFMAATLGVSTLTYLPFAFLNLLSPVISAIYGFTGFTIVPLDEPPAAVGEEDGA